MFKTNKKTCPQCCVSSGDSENLSFLPPLTNCQRVSPNLTSPACVLAAGQTKLDFTAGMEAVDKSDGQQLQHRDNKLEYCFYSQQPSMSSYNSSNLAWGTGTYHQLQSAAYTAGLRLWNRFSSQFPNGLKSHKEENSHHENGIISNPLLSKWGKNFLCFLWAISLSFALAVALVQLKRKTKCLPSRHSSFLYFTNTQMLECRCYNAKANL